MTFCKIYLLEDSEIITEHQSRFRKQVREIQDIIENWKLIDKKRKIIFMIQRAFEIVDSRWKKSIGKIILALTKRSCIGVKMYLSKKQQVTFKNVLK